jgi:WD40 repeat protein
MHRAAARASGTLMRRIVLSLIVGFLAAIACFVLMPIIGLALLRVFTPGIFDSDTLIWILIFVGPPLLAMLVGISFLAGLAGFALAKAKLPDRSWRSAQTFVILLTLAATIAVATLIAWPYFAEPPEIGPQQQGLPTLHLAQTLKAAGNRSGTRRLAWSADGERIAAYGETGIASWSPDGKYQKVFRIHQGFPTWNVLRYLSGHRLLITSPFAEVDNVDERDNLHNIAFAVVDPETGKVLQNISGPHPGGRGPDNEATDLAVTPDERFVAVICGHAVPQINIYATDDWKLVTTIDLKSGEKDDSFSPQGLAFSPDGKTLAVLQGWKGKVKFFEVGAWAFSGSLATYPDPSPESNIITLSALAYSPDGTMIAVGANTGGSWWIYPNGLLAWPGSRTLKVVFPAAPLRVYRISDGKLIASLGSFPGGFYHRALVWSPSGEYLAFQDGLGAVRFWNPFQPNFSVAVARKGVLAPDGIVFSKDSSQLAANFTDGLKIFDVVPTR